MKPTLALIVNANARAVKRRYLRRDPFWKRHVPVELVHVTASLHELDQVIAATRSANVRVIAVLGGDGTLHHTIDTVIRHYSGQQAPIILALAGGTMNGIPRALGTGGRPEEVLRQVLHDLERDGPHLKAHRVLRVTGVDGRTWHGCSFATGLVYRALQQYYRAPEPGLIAAIRASLLPLTASLNGISLQATVGGTPWLADAHTLVASIFANPLLWFRPFGALVKDGKAFYVGATAMLRREIAPRLWSIFRGTCRHPRLRVGPADDVVVRGSGDLGYIIDGELYPTNSGFDVHLTAGPEIRFVAPAR